MLFNSMQFAVFMPVVFCLHWLLPHRFRWPLLLAASYYFYMSWNAKYASLILFTSLVSYLAALLIERTERHAAKKAILAGALLLCLVPLFVFKYLGFFFDTLSAALGVFSIRLHPMTLRLLLPVGISFYTFQTLGYVIDVYRGDIRAERSFGVYATFVSFFPQLVAGPIERSWNLMGQIKNERSFDYETAAYGMKLMVWGFFKKMVIADNLAVFVDYIYGDVRAYSGFALLLASVFFAVQIYCDFSGYSDIARGCAGLLGIKLMENFKSPYFSASIKEFWSRWHISLSTWFRDYLYIPIGGSRVKRPRHYLNLLTTFLVSGLWHGASWTFVVWGGIHGLGQIAENAAGLSAAKKKTGVKYFVRVALVFVFTSLAWVFFRAATLSDAVYVLCHMLTGITRPAAYIGAGLAQTRGVMTLGLKWLALFIALLGAYDYAQLGTDVIERLGRRRAIIRWGVYFLTGLAVLMCHYHGDVAFIYFQF